MPSCTHYPFVCTAINTGENSVSREDRIQHPSAFRAARSQWLISTWSELNQGQCALFDFIELTIVLQPGTVWQCDPTVLLFFCVTSSDFSIDYKEKTNPRWGCWKTDWAGGQHEEVLCVWRVGGLLIYRPVVLCAAVARRAKKTRTAQLLLKLMSIFDCPVNTRIVWKYICTNKFHSKWNASKIEMNSQDILVQIIQHIKSKNCKNYYR